MARITIEFRSDCAIEIDYPGSGNKSVFSYSTYSLCSKIVEFNGGTATSTKQFIWCNFTLKEIRDGAGVLVKKYFANGEESGTTVTFFCRDKLGSVREVTDVSGAIQGKMSFNSFGEATKLEGTSLPEFRFAGYYFHEAGQLYLNLTRPYHPRLASFLSRDLIGENAGPNSYSYVSNDPISKVDPAGLAPTADLITCEMDTGCKRRFRLTNAVISKHITPRHGPQKPGWIPKYNTSDRGIFTDEAWEAQNFHNMLKAVLCDPVDVRESRGNLQHLGQYSINGNSIGFVWTPITQPNRPDFGYTDVVTIITTQANQNNLYTILNAHPGYPVSGE